MPAIAHDINKQHYPRVSIIVINYNGYRWLSLFMPYLVKTQYPDFEIIVLDNASKDKSIQYLKENFTNIRLVVLKENKGTAEAANIGARHSTGEALAFLNNDIEVSDDWLIKAILKLTSDPNIAVVQCKMMRYDNRKKIDCIGMSVDRYNFLWSIGHFEIDYGQFDTLEEIGGFNAAAMIIWKHIFDEVGCFDNLYFMYHDDIDLSWRIRLAGYKICPATSSIVYHVGSATSNTRTLDNKWNPSPFFAFLNSRNNIYCWLKNSRSKTIIIYWPIFLFGNLLITFLLFASISPRVGFAYFKGLLWPLKNFRHILDQRKKMEPIIKKRRDNILFVKGVIKESSNFSNMVKRAPSIMKRLMTKTSE